MSPRPLKGADPSVSSTIDERGDNPYYAADGSSARDGD